MKRGHKPSDGIMSDEEDIEAEQAAVKAKPADTRKTTGGKSPRVQSTEELKKVQLQELREKHATATTNKKKAPIPASIKELTHEEKEAKRIEVQNALLIKQFIKNAKVIEAKFSSLQKVWYGRMVSNSTSVVYKADSLPHIKTHDLFWQFNKLFVEDCFGSEKDKCFAFLGSIDEPVENKELILLGLLFGNIPTKDVVQAKLLKGIGLMLDADYKLSDTPNTAKDTAETRDAKAKSQQRYARWYKVVEEMLNKVKLLWTSTNSSRLFHKVVAECCVPSSTGFVVSNESHLVDPPQIPTFPSTSLSVAEFVESMQAYIGIPTPTPTSTKTHETFTLTSLLANHVEFIFNVIKKGWVAFPPTAFVDEVVRNLPPPNKAPAPAPTPTEPATPAAGVKKVADPVATVNQQAKTVPVPSPAPNKKATLAPASPATQPTPAAATTSPSKVATATSNKVTPAATPSPTPTTSRPAAAKTPQQPKVNMAVATKTPQPTPQPTPQVKATVSAVAAPSTPAPTPTPSTPRSTTSSLMTGHPATHYQQYTNQPLPAGVSIPRPASSTPIPSMIHGSGPGVASLPYGNTVPAAPPPTYSNYPTSTSTFGTQSTVGVLETTTQSTTTAANDVFGDTDAFSPADLRFDLSFGSELPNFGGPDQQ
jgi:hypothetical protein